MEETASSQLREDPEKDNVECSTPSESTNLEEPPKDSFEAQQIESDDVSQFNLESFSSNSNLSFHDVARVMNHLAETKKNSDGETTDEGSHFEKILKPHLLKLKEEVIKQSASNTETPSSKSQVLFQCALPSTSQKSQSPPSKKSSKAHKKKTASTDKSGNRQTRHANPPENQSEAGFINIGTISLEDLKKNPKLSMLDIVSKMEKEYQQKVLDKKKELDMAATEGFFLKSEGNFDNLSSEKKLALIESSMQLINENISCSSAPNVLINDISTPISHETEKTTDTDKEQSPNKDVLLVSDESHISSALKHINRLKKIINKQQLKKRTKTGRMKRNSTIITIPKLDPTEGSNPDDPVTVNLMLKMDSTSGSKVKLEIDSYTEVKKRSTDEKPVKYEYDDVAAVDSILNTRKNSVSEQKDDENAIENIKSTKKSKKKNAKKKCITKMETLDDAPTVPDIKEKIVSTKEANQSPTEDQVTKSSGKSSKKNKKKKKQEKMKLQLAEKTESENAAVVQQSTVPEITNKEPEDVENLIEIPTLVPTSEYEQVEINSTDEISGNLTDQTLMPKSEDPKMDEQSTVSTLKTTESAIELEIKEDENSKEDQTLMRKSEEATVEDLKIDEKSSTISEINKKDTEKPKKGSKLKRENIKATVVKSNLNIDKKSTVTNTNKDNASTKESNEELSVKDVNLKLNEVSTEINEKDDFPQEANEESKKDQCLVNESEETIVEDATLNLKEPSIVSDIEEKVDVTQEHEDFTIKLDESTAASEINDEINFSHQDENIPFRLDESFTEINNKVEFSQEANEEPKEDQNSEHKSKESAVEDFSIKVDESYAVPEINKIEDEKPKKGMKLKCDYSKPIVTKAASDIDSKSTESKTKTDSNKKSNEEFKDDQTLEQISKESTVEDFSLKVDESSTVPQINKQVDEKSKKGVKLKRDCSRLIVTKVASDIDSKSTESKTKKDSNEELKEDQTLEQKSKESVVEDISVKVDESSTVSEINKIEDETPKKGVKLKHDYSRPIVTKAASDIDSKSTESKTKKDIDSNKESTEDSKTITKTGIKESANEKSKKDKKLKSKSEKPTVSEPVLKTVKSTVPEIKGNDSKKTKKDEKLKSKSEKSIVAVPVIKTGKQSTVPEKNENANKKAKKDEKLKPKSEKPTIAESAIKTDKESTVPDVEKKTSENLKEEEKLKPSEKSSTITDCSLETKEQSIVPEIQINIDSSTENTTDDKLEKFTLISSKKNKNASKLKPTLKEQKKGKIDNRQQTITTKSLTKLKSGKETTSEMHKKQTTNVIKTFATKQRRADSNKTEPKIEVKASDQKDVKETARTHPNIAVLPEIKKYSEVVQQPKSTNKIDGEVKIPKDNSYAETRNVPTAKPESNTAQATTENVEENWDDDVDEAYAFTYASHKVLDPSQITPQQKIIMYRKLYGLKGNSSNNLRRRYRGPINRPPPNWKEQGRSTPKAAPKLNCREFPSLPESDKYRSKENQFAWQHEATVRTDQPPIENVWNRNLRKIKEEPVSTNVNTQSQSTWVTENRNKPNTDSNNLTDNKNVQEVKKIDQLTWQHGTTARTDQPSIENVWNRNLRKINEEPVSTNVNTQSQSTWVTENTNKLNADSNNLTDNKNVQEMKKRDQPIAQTSQIINTIQYVNSQSAQEITTVPENANIKPSTVSQDSNLATSLVEESTEECEGKSIFEPEDAEKIKQELFEEYCKTIDPNARIILRNPLSIVSNNASLVKSTAVITKPFKIVDSEPTSKTDKSNEQIVDENKMIQFEEATKQSDFSQTATTITNENTIIDTKVTVPTLQKSTLLMQMFKELEDDEDDDNFTTIPQHKIDSSSKNTKVAIEQRQDKETPTVSSDVTKISQTPVIITNKVRTPRDDKETPAVSSDVTKFAQTPVTITNKVTTPRDDKEPPAVSSDVTKFAQTPVTITNKVTTPRDDKETPAVSSDVTKFAQTPVTITNKVTTPRDDKETPAVSSKNEFPIKKVLTSYKEKEVRIVSTKNEPIVTKNVQTVVTDANKVVTSEKEKDTQIFSSKSDTDAPKNVSTPLIVSKQPTSTQKEKETLIVSSNSDSNSQKEKETTVPFKSYSAAKNVQSPLNVTNKVVSQKEKETSVAFQKDDNVVESVQTPQIVTKKIISSREEKKTSTVPYKTNYTNTTRNVTYKERERSTIPFKTNFITRNIKNSVIATKKMTTAHKRYDTRVVSSKSAAIVTKNIKKTQTRPTETMIKKYNTNIDEPLKKIIEEKANELDNIQTPAQEIPEVITTQIEPIVTPVTMEEYAIQPVNQTALSIYPNINSQHNAFYNLSLPQQEAISPYPLINEENSAIWFIESLLTMLETVLSINLQESSDQPTTKVPEDVKNIIKNLEIFITSIKPRILQNNYYEYEPFISILKDLTNPALIFASTVCPKMSKYTQMFFNFIYVITGQQALHLINGTTLPFEINNYNILCNLADEEYKIYVTRDAVIHLIIKNDYIHYRIDFSVDYAIRLINVIDRVTMIITSSGNAAILKTEQCMMYQNNDIQHISIEDMLSFKNRVAKATTNGVYFQDLQSVFCYHLGSNGVTVEDTKFKTFSEELLSKTFSGFCKEKSYVFALNLLKSQFRVDSLVDGSIHYYFGCLKISCYKDGQLCIERKNSPAFLLSIPSSRGTNLTEGIKQGIVRMVTPSCRTTATVPANSNINPLQILMVNNRKQYVNYDYNDLLVTHNNYSTGYNPPNSNI